MVLARFHNGFTMGAWFLFVHLRDGSNWTGKIGNGREFMLLRFYFEFLVRTLSSVGRILSLWSGVL
jgi:hypothetical protein